MGKRLYRSRSERMLFGVSGGMAEYFDVDPTLVRIAWVVVAIISAGVGFLAYLALAIIIPESTARERPSGEEASNMEGEEGSAYDPVDSREEREEYETAGAAADSREEREMYETADAAAGVGRERVRRQRGIIFGVALIALGFFFLSVTLDLLTWFDWRFWPVALILLGVLLVVRRLGGEN